MDWASTYQAVPTLIDTQLETHGARRCVHSRGEGDARSDFDGQFSEWYQGLWSSLADSLALSSESTRSGDGTPIASHFGEQADDKPGSDVLSG